MEYKNYYDYRVYEDGSIYSNKSKKFLKYDTDAWGYYQVTLFINKVKFRIKVHRLVCHLFNGMELLKENTVDHIDGNKTNNHYSNLECVTQYENNKRAREKGLNTLYKEHNGRASKCFLYNNNLYYSWELAEILNVSIKTITTYKNKYKYLNTAKNFFKKYGINIIK